ncbi:MAG: hypothetical protein J7502_06330 [Flavisolibacter sp.]|nr:hypothetical protein [Flavisolibacter sp.]
MQAQFTKTLNGHEYEFHQVGYPQFRDQLVYHISFYNEELDKRETFRMKLDEEGMWKIQAQVLPDYVHDAELDLNDAIQDNQNTQ